VTKNGGPVAEQTTVSSVHEVLAVEPVIRRVIAARAANAADVDDLVQDCLERLLVAHRRLAPEAVLPYAVVTARNLVSSNARTAIRVTAARPSLHDASEPEQPEEVLLAGETRRAMTTALARLSDTERQDLLAYQGLGASEGPASGPARGALRVRMARTRAKLRLEYLLAYRHLELPTPRCRSVLLAISAGDTRRQRQLDAAQHLLDCETCAILSEPLDRRSVALTAIAIPGALLAWLVRQARVHPVHTAGVVAAGSAVVAATAVLGPRLAAGPPAPVGHVQVSTPANIPAPRPGPVISNLSIGGRPVSDATAEHSLRSMVGEHADASGVVAVAAITRNGFWIGSARARIWVELVGPLRPLRVRAGDRVIFGGAVVGNSPSFPGQGGLTSRGDAELLARQGAHLAVSTISISVTHR
jgi:RNA polymerase sigma factor (sigma-70 family)